MMTFFTETTTATILWLLYRTTCINRYPQLRTGGLCWSKVLLPACPCWWQLVHSVYGEDARVLVNGVYLHLLPLPSNRHHRSNDDCLKGKRENYHVCSVQYCVQQLCTVQCTHIWTDLTVVCWLDLAFLWLYCVLQFICVRLFHVIVYLCMCAFVVLDLVSSVLCQEIGG